MHARTAHALTASMLTLTFAGPLFAQCDPAWSDRYATRGVLGWLNAGLTWDDGTGEKVYIAGEFSTIDDIPSIGLERGANSIAAWDGTRWNKLALGLGGTGIGQSGLREVKALATFDPDGPGPQTSALMVGGNFAWANGQIIRGIARWDGTQWHEVGGGILGNSTTLNRALQVLSIAVFDADGAGPAMPQLFIAGDFEFAGDSFVNGVARWDGAQWREVGGAFPSGTRAQSLVAYDPDGAGPLPELLYLIGRFSQVPNGVGGLIPAAGLARWDGSQWSAEPGLVTNASSPPNAMGVHDDGVSRSLWVSGGSMALPGGTLAPMIARKHNGTWAPAPGLPSSGVASFAMKQLDADMYLSLSTSALVRWSPADPNTVETMGYVLRGGISTLFTADFDLADDEPARLVVCGNDNFARFTALRDSFGTDKAFDNVAVLSEGTFQPLPTRGSDALGVGVPTNGHPTAVTRLKVLDPDGAGPQPEKLFIGGTFNGAGGVITANAASFDGTTFGAIPMFVNTGDVGYCDNNPTCFDDVSYPVIDDFATLTSGTTTTLFASARDIGSGASVLQWNGTRMHPIGFPDASTHRILGFDDGSGPALWAFNISNMSVLPHLGMIGNSVTVNGAARWRPATGWEDAGAGIPAAGFSVREVAVADTGSGPRLYAAGFTFAAPQRYLAFWNGSAWDFSPISTLAGDFALLGSIVPFQGELYAGGRFLSIDGVSAVSIARWNGSSWAPLGTGLTDAVNGSPSVAVSSLVVHDDGSGPALFVSGRFTHAGGVAADNLAKWDGSNWSAVQASQSNGYQADAMASFNGGLFVGGSFYQWGGLSAAGLTELRRPCDPCQADFNGSGSVTVQDIFDFLAAWFSGVTTADVNHSGSVTVQDIFDFLSAWFAGC